jgi:hypothetical protein
MMKYGNETFASLNCGNILEQLDECHLFCGYLTTLSVAQADPSGRAV